MLCRVARLATRAGLGTAAWPLAAGLVGCSRGSTEPGEWYSNGDLAGGCVSPGHRPRWRNVLADDSGLCPGEDPASARTAEAVVEVLEEFMSGRWRPRVRRIDQGPGDEHPLDAVGSGATFTTPISCAASLGLQAGEDVSMEFARRRQGSFVETGLDDEGLRLRSRLAQPKPALFVPRTAVQRYVKFSVWVALPQSGGATSVWLARWKRQHAVDGTFDRPQQSPDAFRRRLRDLAAVG